MAIRTHLIQTPEEWDRLESYAASFDHEINRFLSYVVFKTEADVWLGYLAIIKTPVLVPAVHPSTSPKDVSRVLGFMEGWSRVQFGQAFVLVPIENPFEKSLEKHGFVDQNLKLMYAE